VRGNEEKRKALDIIMENYSGKSSFEYPEEAVDSTAIIKVRKHKGKKVHSFGGIKCSSPNLGAPFKKLN
jgi:hypothetical protein